MTYIRISYISTKKQKLTRGLQIQDALDQQENKETTHIFEDWSREIAQNLTIWMSFTAMLVMNIFFRIA